MDADLVLLLHFPGHPIMTSPVAKLLFVMYINHDEYTLLAQARACQRRTGYIQLFCWIRKV